MKRKLKEWLRVTNELVATYADKDCRNCQGGGFVGEEPKYSICSCATLAWRRAYPPGSPNIRVHVQRIGNRDYHKLEYKPLVAVD